jgi:hypothetical protein
LRDFQGCARRWVEWRQERLNGGKNNYELRMTNYGSRNLAGGLEMSHFTGMPSAFKRQSPHLFPNAGFVI